MREVLVVGSGAMACLAAARLAESGVGVALAGTWPEALRAIRERGAIVEPVPAEEPAGATRAAPGTYRVDAFDRSEPAPPTGLALVLVKSHQTSGVADYVAEAIGATGIAITLQNGLGNRESLAARLGPDRVAAGATSAGATLLGPGRVRAGGGGFTVIGPDAAGRGPQDLAAAARVLAAAGLPAEVVADVDPYLWLKLAVNAGINAVTAVTGLPNGSLAGGAARELATLATLEAARVAAAEAIELPADPIETMIEVVTRTAANRSSMLQDIDRGRPTEIDAISGEVLRRAERSNTAVPVTRWLIQEVQVRENGGSPRPLSSLVSHLAALEADPEPAESFRL